jgi:copper chaperone CopZ
MATITLKVAGMKCGGCETQVQEAVKALAGVNSARASHRAGSVEIEYDPGQASLDAIRKAVQDKGYSVE